MTLASGEDISGGKKYLFGFRECSQSLDNRNYSNCAGRARRELLGAWESVLKSGASIKKSPDLSRDQVRSKNVALLDHFP